MAEATILLIEDDATYAKLATILLTDSGYTVTWASTAEDGLRIARQKPPDLILMDINLPGMDGPEALRMLRQDPRTRHTPTVALTADRVSRDEEHERAREAGFDAYVEKPVDRVTFHALVGPFLASPRAPQ